MKTFKQHINEVFDSQIPIHNDGWSPGIYKYNFDVDGERFVVKILTEIIRGKTESEVSFYVDSKEIDTKYELTGSNKGQFQILAAVLKAIAQHFNTHKMKAKDVILFSGKGASREKAYHSICKHVAKLFRMSYDKENLGGGDYLFVLTKI